MVHSFSGVGGCSSTNEPAVSFLNGSCRPTSGHQWWLYTWSLDHLHLLLAYQCDVCSLHAFKLQGKITNQKVVTKTCPTQILMLRCPALSWLVTVTTHAFCMYEALTNWSCLICMNEFLPVEGFLKFHVQVSEIPNMTYKQNSGLLKSEQTFLSCINNLNTFLIW